GDETVAVALRTVHGERSYAQVAPGANAYQSFKVRGGALEAGEALVAVTDVAGTTTEISAAYDALTCASRGKSGPRGAVRPMDGTAGLGRAGLRRRAFPREVGAHHEPPVLDPRGEGPVERLAAFAHADDPVAGPRDPRGVRRQGVPHREVDAVSRPGADVHLGAGPGGVLHDVGQRLL